MYCADINENLHIMNKRSLDRHYDDLMRFANEASNG